MNSVISSQMSQPLKTLETSQASQALETSQASETSDTSDISDTSQIIVKHLGLIPYDTCFSAMKDFTDSRQKDCLDEIWFLEHPPVFTQGQAGKAEHLINPGQIPVIQSDRGGQITYHGPGQLICYVLIDIQRKGLTIRDLVCALEQSVIDLVSEYALQASRQSGAPGIYINDRKMASIGLRIRRGFSYHGLSLNVNMDLAPFQRIHPCGYPSLKMTQLGEFVSPISLEEVSEKLLVHLEKQLGYNKIKPLMNI